MTLPQQANQNNNGKLEVARATIQINRQRLSQYTLHSQLVIFCGQVSMCWIGIVVLPISHL